MIDRIVPHPAETPPAPAPKPAKLPVTPPKGCAGASGWLVAAVLAGVLAWPHVAAYLPHREPAAPDPAAPFVRAGQIYASALAATHAAGLVKAAEAVEAGKSVEDAMAAEQAAFQSLRQAQFVTHVQPALSAVLPEGTEPKDDAQRKAFGRALRFVAVGETK